MGCSENHPMALLVQRIEELQGRHWTIEFRWCYREGNEVVNWLAIDALGQESGLKLLDEPPRLLKPILDNDLDPGRRQRWVFV